ncbi:MAG TPA: type II secretion system protein GspG [Candidatus Polarisedimenticolaceae bacterium]|nr:type II secretion system protein GspG [Candidatus Polarisedimenticolaceae bacterium]
MRPRARCDAGFSLIELLIVVAVIGIIAGIAMVNLLGAMERSKQRATMADMRTIAVGVEVYHIDKGFLPTASSMVQLRSILIPYQASVVPVVDRWGHFFSYSQDGTNYTIESFGRDGVDGSEVTYSTRANTNLDLQLSNGLFLFAPE